MSVEVKVPDLPESVSDATIVSWRKQPGEKISRDESLVDLETDKVVLEVPSPIDGIVSKQLQAEGDVVEAGQLLAVIDEVGAVGIKAKDEISGGVGEGKLTTGKAKIEEEKIITPSAQKMMVENNINSNDVQGSGKGGRVLKDDVQIYMKNYSETDRPLAPLQFDVIEEKEPEVKSLAGVVDTDQTQRIEKRVPMTRLRKRIAERLLDAQHNAAILTTFNEVNMQPVMDLRTKYKDLFLKKHDVKLGFMSFFIKASVEALKQFPAVNASIDGDDIVYHGFFDIGVAVASPRGLVVPVLRNADQMSLAEIERGIAELVDKAKNNKLSIEDMTGGTFSITNGGVFGSMLSTPIINPPQSGILGMHKIQQRAMVVEGEIVAQPIMYLAMSYDHRIIDGAEAVQFLVAIKNSLEDPARILVGV